MDKAGRLTGETLKKQAVSLVVTERAKNIGLELAPRNPKSLRQTRQQGQILAEQIQLALGHESIQTTERSLGIQQDLLNAPGQFLGIVVE